jgi:hypothetical protein
VTDNSGLDSAGRHPVHGFLLINHKQQSNANEGASNSMLPCYACHITTSDTVTDGTGVTRNAVKHGEVRHCRLYIECRPVESVPSVSEAGVRQEVKKTKIW